MLCFVYLQAQISKRLCRSNGSNAFFGAPIRAAHFFSTKKAAVKSLTNA